MRRAGRHLMISAMAGLIVATIGATSAEARLCVAHVRNLTGIMIPANAWGWWDGAAGVYERGHVPTVGSILVWRRAGNLPLGHVGVVSGIVDSRTILVDHSWDSDALRRNQRVVDNSPNNDWSRVSVYYTPTGNMGGDYPIYGFVYPPGTEPSADQQQVYVAAAEEERESLMQARAYMVRQLGLGRVPGVPSTPNQSIVAARYVPGQAASPARTVSLPRGAAAPEPAVPAAAPAPAAPAAPAGLASDVQARYAAAFEFPDATPEWIDPDILAARAAELAERDAAD